MVNLKYLLSVLYRSMHNESKTIEKKMFLSAEDIIFFEEHDCLKSISDKGCVVGQYVVEFDKEHLLRLCS